MTFLFLSLIFLFISKQNKTKNFLDVVPYLYQLNEVLSQEPGYFDDETKTTATEFLESLKTNVLAHDDYLPFIGIFDFLFFKKKNKIYIKKK